MDPQKSAKLFAEGSLQQPGLCESLWVSQVGQNVCAFWHCDLSPGLESVRKYIYIYIYICICIYICSHVAHAKMAVGQHQWYHFGIGAPPSLVYLRGIGMFTGGTGF